MPEQAGTSETGGALSVTTDFLAEIEPIACKIELLATTAILQIAGEVAKIHEAFRYHRNEGGFVGYMKKRLRYSSSTAYRLLNVHTRFGKNVSHAWETLPLTAIYLLAEPSTPERALDIVADILRQGDKPTTIQVRNIIKRAKGVTDENFVENKDKDAEGSEGETTPALLPASSLPLIPEPPAPAVNGNDVDSTATAAAMGQQLAALASKELESEQPGDAGAADDSAANDSDKPASGLSAAEKEAARAAWADHARAMAKARQASEPEAEPEAKQPVGAGDLDKQAEDAVDDMVASLTNVRDFSPDEQLAIWTKWAFEIDFKIPIGFEPPANLSQETAAANVRKLDEIAAYIHALRVAAAAIAGDLVPAVSAPPMSAAWASVKPGVSKKSFDEIVKTIAFAGYDLEKCEGIPPTQRNEVKRQIKTLHEVEEKLSEVAKPIAKPAGRKSTNKELDLKALFNLKGLADDKERVLAIQNHAAKHGSASVPPKVRKAIEKLPRGLLTNWLEEQRDLQRNV
jgi:hypothetical protein